MDASAYRKPKRTERAERAKRALKPRERWWFLYIVLIAVLIAMTAIIAALYQWETDLLAASAAAQVGALPERTAEKVQDLLGRYSSAAERAAQRLVFDERRREQVLEIARENLERTSHATSVWFHIDPSAFADSTSAEDDVPRRLAAILYKTSSGDIVGEGGSGIENQLADHSLYKKTRAAGATTRTVLFPSALAANGEADAPSAPIFSVATPVRSGDVIIGVAGMEFSLQSVQHFLRDAMKRSNVRLILLEDYAVVVADDGDYRGHRSVRTHSPVLDETVHAEWREIRNATPRRPLLVRLEKEEAVFLQILPIRTSRPEGVWTLVSIFPLRDELAKIDGRCKWILICIYIVAALISLDIWLGRRKRAASQSANTESCCAGNATTGTALSTPPAEAVSEGRWATLEWRKKRYHSLAWIFFFPALLFITLLEKRYEEEKAADNYEGAKAAVDSILIPLVFGVPLGALIIYAYFFTGR